MIERQMKECTFRPRINKHMDYQSDDEHEHEENETLHSSTRVERGSKIRAWERLNKLSQDMMERSQRRKEQSEREKLAECTFQPKLAQSSWQVSSSKGRLYRTDALLQRDQQIERQRQEKLNKECPFRPKIKTASPHGQSKRYSTPVHERLRAWGASKSEENNLRRRAKDQEEITQCTFHPTLVAKPRNPSPQRKLHVTKPTHGDHKRPASPVHERLYQMSLEQQKRFHQREQDALREFPFKPHVK